MYIIDKNAENEIIIKKSRFITKLYYIEDVNKVNDIINELKKEYKKCTHICYSYIIGPNAKAVDDGEPSGTAGKPILNVLQKKNMTNVLCVVIRYFGGIKLGAGGLTRAYSQSVSETLKNAEIVETELVDLYKITIDYTYTRKFEHLLKQQNIKCISQEYNEQVSYLCYLRDHTFLDQIQELTNNQFQYKKIGCDYIEKDV